MNNTENDIKSQSCDTKKSGKLINESDQHQTLISSTTRINKWLFCSLTK